MKGKSKFARLTEAELSTLVRMVGKDGTTGDDKLWFNFEGEDDFNSRIEQAGPL